MPPSGCEAPVSIGFANITVNATEAGSNVTYTCFEGYRHVTQMKTAVSTCNGTDWIPLWPACEKSEHFIYTMFVMRKSTHILYII